MIDMLKVEALEIVVGLAKEKTQDIRQERYKSYVTTSGKDYVVDKFESAIIIVDEMREELEPDWKWGD